MKKLDELNNIQLLYEVKADAMQPIDQMVDDSAIGCLVDFARTVWGKGIEALEREIRYYPKDIQLFVDMINGVHYIMEEVAEEKLLEKMVINYWSKEVKGKEAFDKFLTILTIMKISEGASPRELQQMLLYQLIELNEISGVGKGCSTWIKNM